MSTPFKKAFPNADENTVFEVVKVDLKIGHLSVGDECRLERDKGTTCPWFYFYKYDSLQPLNLDQIRIKEPQLKKGDWCLVGDYEDSWEGGEAEYVCNLENTFGIKGEYKHLVLTDDKKQEATSWKYVKPLPQTQKVTLQDGTELTIPNDAVDKLREEYS